MQVARQLSYDTAAVDDNADERSQKLGSPVRTVTFVLANTILGAGMLGLPSAFAKCGIFVGFIMLFLFAAAATFSLHLLSECADRVGRPATFKRMCEAATPGFSVLFDGAIGIKCFGVATSYLIVCGDNMVPAMQAIGVTSGILHSRRFWVLISLALAAPLSFLKSISRLRFTAAFSLLCVCIIIMTVVLFAAEPSDIFNPCAPDPSSSCRGDIMAVEDGASILRALPIYVFSYTCHQNIISTTNELARPTPMRAAMGMMSAVGLSLLTYSVLATAGYLTFGSYVNGDILKSYPQASGIVAVARIGISFIVTMCYPLQAHPSRGCFTSIWLTAHDELKRRRASPDGVSSAAACTAPLAAPLVRDEEEAAANHDYDHGGGREGSVVAFLVITCVFLITSLLIALTVTDLSLVLSIVGATGSTTVSYILPGGCYVALFREQRGCKWYAALLVLCLGMVIMPLSLALIAIPE